MTFSLRAKFKSCLYALTVFYAFTLEAKEIYVAKVETTALQNGTIESPYGSLVQALNEAKPGDEVLIRGGSYVLDAPIHISINGTQNLPITIAAYLKEKVVFDFSKYLVPSAKEGVNGPPYPHDYGAITVLNSKYITIKNIEVIRSKCAGIQARGSSYIKIQNCKTYDTYSSGISAWDSDSIQIENNDVSLACNLGPHESITISRSTNFIVRDNTVHDNTFHSSSNGGEGFDCKEGSMHGKVSGNLFYNLHRQALYIDAWDQHIEDIEVFNNTAFNCSFGLVLATEQKGDMNNIRVHHNIFYNNRCSGIEIINWSDHTTLEGPKTDIMIYNNTVYNNGWQDRWRAFGGIHIHAPNVNNVTVTGNIISNNCAFQLAYDNQPGLVFSYNLIDGYNKLPLRDITGSPREGFPYIPIDGDSAVKSSPLFIDALNADFRLADNSPAIDKGNPNTFFQDADGSRSDIGAIPNLSKHTSTIWEITSDVNVFPNPTAQGEATYITVNKNRITKITACSITSNNHWDLNSVYIHDNLSRISLEGIGKGIYLLEIITSNSVYNYKMVIQ